MRLRCFSALAFTGLALATVDFENWHPPGHSDVRGPCPCLNSLANHGILPHDGKNYTIPVLVKALTEAVNVSPEFAATISLLGTFTAADPTKGSFDLTDLLNHNLFEHDASLSRADFEFGGDVQTFRPEIFAEFLKPFEGKEFVTLPDAATARYSRVQTERSRNPHFTYNVAHQITSYSETVFYFRTLVDPRTNQTPVEFVKIFFEQERLPFKEGWRTPTTQIDGRAIASDTLQLALLTPEKRSDYGDRFEGNNGTLPKDFHGGAGTGGGVGGGTGGGMGGGFGHGGGFGGHHGGHGDGRDHHKDHHKKVSGRKGGNKGSHRSRRDEMEE